MAGTGSDGNASKAALLFIETRALDVNIPEEEGGVGPANIDDVSAVGRPLCGGDHYGVLGERAGDVNCKILRRTPSPCARCVSGGAEPERGGNRQVWYPIFKGRFLDTDGRTNHGGHSRFSMTL